ncbi:MAG TPA: hypothetical protein VMU29_14060 [Smithella sp.]|nr:hypothetical protein [Smithella sp.]
MKKVILLFISLILPICFAGQVYAKIVFSIDVQKTMDKQTPDKKITKEKSQSKMQLEIGDNYFSSDQNGVRHIFDFDHKRIFVMNLSGKLYFDDSLFSYVGFKAHEFQNRLAMSQALSKAGITNNPMLPVFSEHLFSMRQKNEKSGLSQVLKNDSVYFYAADKELFSYSKQGEQVSPENKIMFVKFIRYVFGGHPQILGQLLSDNIIPGSINIYLPDLSPRSVELKISPVKTTSQRAYSLKGYTPGVWNDEEDPFIRFLNDIKYSKTINLEHHLAMLQTKANEYYNSGDYLDAMLAYLEYNLASGLPFPPAFQEQKATIVKDEKVKELLTVLGDVSKENAKNDLVILQTLQSSAKHYGHVIKITEADMQIKLGKHQEAKKLFYEALKASPHITGAYKDLGDLYYSEYSDLMAWRCWDVARKIAPTHVMLIPINEFEAKLVKECPEFF